MWTEDWGRPDRTRAAVINDVMRALPLVGAHAVARFLDAMGVPLPVICRVISEPERRRQPGRADQR